MREDSIIAFLRARGVELDSSTNIIAILSQTDEEISIAYDGRIDIKKTIDLHDSAKRLSEVFIDDILISGVDDDYLERLPDNLRSSQMNNQEAHEHWSKDELSEAIYHLTFALQGIICHLEGDDEE
jgi:hypothetical protein